MNTLLDTLWYFCYITVELIVLFLAISAIVEIILMYIPQEKISKRLEKTGFFGNILAAGFGALTPFCHLAQQCHFSSPLPCSIRL